MRIACILPLQTEGDTYGEYEEMAQAGGVDVTTRRQLAFSRFQQFTDRHPDARVLVRSVSRALGVAERTLREHCVQQTGMGPKKYQYLQRMYHAHRALRQADPTMTTVTSVAFNCGFGHLGRFSVGYKEIFGESPSATLRRGNTR